MDATAIVSVVGSSAVALATIASNVWTRRGDRKHEASLDFERRTWDAKRATLTATITHCNMIRLASGGVDIASPSTKHLSEDGRRRLPVLNTFERHRNELAKEVGSLMAYAGDSVWRPVEQLNTIIESEFWDHFDDMMTLRHIREEKESAIDRMEFEIAATNRDHEKTIQRAIAEVCTLDVDAVHTLCVSIIAAARKDLRGANK